MRRFLSMFFIAALFPHVACAEQAKAVPPFKTIEFTFDSIIDLGARVKPRNSIDTTQEALDFILADKIVRAGISKKIEEGYAHWKARAEKVVGEDIWIVRVDSTSVIPPYSCYFRFDSIGNDKRDIPANGCHYE
jgi:hypothetical protein